MIMDAHVTMSAVFGRDVRGGMSRAQLIQQSDSVSIREKASFGREQRCECS